MKPCHYNTVFVSLSVCTCVCLRKSDTASGSVAAMVYAFSNTTVAVNTVVDSIAINYTNPGSVPFPISVGFVHNDDKDQCSDTSKQVVTGTISAVGCPLRPVSTNKYVVLNHSLKESLF